MCLRVCLRVCILHAHARFARVYAHCACRMSLSELAQENFLLTTELRKLKNELATLKAMNALDESEEVARIKTAYNQLETELVTLRQKGPYAEVVEVPWGNEDSSTQSMITHLEEALADEKLRYTLLETKYQQMRKDVATSSVAYSEISTCPSPLSYKFSSESTIHAIVKPELEAMFSNPAKAPRRTALAPESKPAVKLIVADKPAKKSADPSYSRLSKIARFRS